MENEIVYLMNETCTICPWEEVIFCWVSASELGRHSVRSFI